MTDERQDQTTNVDEIREQLIALGLAGARVGIRARRPDGRGETLAVGYIIGVRVSPHVIVEVPGIEVSVVVPLAAIIEVRELPIPIDVETAAAEEGSSR